MAGQDDRNTFLRIQSAQRLSHLNDPAGIQTVDGLIQKQELRFSHQGDSKPKTLFHSERELFSIRFSPFIQTNLPQHVPDLLLSRYSFLDAIIFQVSLHGELRIESRLLDHGACASPLPRQFPLPADAEQAYLPFRGEDLSCEKLKKSGFAGAVVPDQPEDLSAPHAQIYVF